MDPTEAARILEQELERGRAMIAAAETPDELERAKVALLGRKAPISAVQSSLGSLPGEARRDVGRRTNDAFAELRAALAARLGPGFGPGAWEAYAKGEKFAQVEAGLRAALGIKAARAA